MFHTPDSEEPTFSETIELDLASVEPSIAGPKRPQDRIALTDAKAAFLESLREFDPDAAEELGNGYDEAVAELVPRLGPAGRRATTTRAASPGTPVRARRRRRDAARDDDRCR